MITAIGYNIDSTLLRKRFAKEVRGITLFFLLGCFLCIASMSAQEPTTATVTSSAARSVSPNISPGGSVDAFRAGMISLEKQDFRSAADAFRTAYMLDSGANKHLHYFAKALFLAEMKNLDSVRFVQQLMTLYAERGGEESALQRQKAQVLANDVESRLERLVQDSLQASQKQKSGYMSGYQYSYQATVKKPTDSVPERRVFLAGQGHFRLVLFGEVGGMLQAASAARQPSEQQPFFDQWGSFGLETRGGFWGGLSPDVDWGADGTLALRFGTLLDSGSIPTLVNPAKALQRLYEADASARVRLNFSAGTVGIAGFAHVEYVETVRIGAYKPILYSENYRTVFSIPQGGDSFNLVGAGLGWEPRDGEQGLLAEGRYYFLPILGTETASRLMLARIGYSFGRASLLAEGALAARVFAGETVQTLSLKLGLRWHIIQTNAEKDR